ncbi:MAG: WG repeat-containing protein [Cyclobacteriaceae bacterium]
MALKVFCFIICLTVLVPAFGQLESNPGKNKKIGFTDVQGDWVIQPIYDAADEFDDYAYAFVKLKGKWGLIDQKGNTILPFEYAKAYVDELENVRIVMKNSRYGLVDLTTGKESLPCIYENMYYAESLYDLPQALVVVKNKKAGIVNFSGQEIVACQFNNSKEPFFPLESGFFRVKQNTLAGILDSTGKLIVPCQFDEVEISLAQDSSFNTKSKGRYGLYSFTGNEIVAPISENEIEFAYENTYAIISQKKKYGVIDRTGKLIVPCTFPNDDEAYLELERILIPKN